MCFTSTCWRHFNCYKFPSRFWYFNCDDRRWEDPVVVFLKFKRDFVSNEKRKLIKKMSVSFLHDNLMWVFSTKGLNFLRENLSLTFKVYCRRENELFFRFDECSRCFMVKFHWRLVHKNLKMHRRRKKVSKFLIQHPIMSVVNFMMKLALFELMETRCWPCLSCYCRPEPYQINISS